MTPTTCGRDTVQSFAARLARTRVSGPGGDGRRARLAAGPAAVHRGRRLFLSLSWLGVFRCPAGYWRGSPSWRRSALAALAALYPLRFYRRPAAEEIDRRIERANALVHTPVWCRRDRRRAARRSAFADALWREHQRRMAAQPRRRRRRPAAHPRSRARPLGRCAPLAALLLVTAFAFSFGPLGGTIADGFRAHGRIEALPPRIDAWVTPPAYTGKAPVFLTADSQSRRQHAVTVPEGSDLSLAGDRRVGRRDAGLHRCRGQREREIEPQPAPADARRAGAPRRPGLRPCGSSPASSTSTASCR